MANVYAPRFSYGAWKTTTFVAGLRLEGIVPRADTAARRHRRLGQSLDHKIALRLMSRVGRSDAGEFARPMQPCQHDRVAPVRLDAFARPFRDQRRRDHHTVVA
jgi:hypothetical protein